MEVRALRPILRPITLDTSTIIILIINNSSTERINNSHTPTSSNNCSNNAVPPLPTHLPLPRTLASPYLRQVPLDTTRALEDCPLVAAATAAALVVVVPMLIVRVLVALLEAVRRADLWERLGHYIVDA